MTGSWQMEWANERWASTCSSSILFFFLLFFFFFVLCVRFYLEAIGGAVSSYPTLIWIINFFVDDLFCRIIKCLITLIIIESSISNVIKCG